MAAVPEADTLVVVDGYHAFMALPTDHGMLADRAFYLAGGYKYAMAGEGCSFCHCPPGYGPRPVDTGWFAAFGALTDTAAERVAYAPGGGRFLGATFDPSGLYRFNAVQGWLDETGVDVVDIHAHVVALQKRFLDQVAGLLPPPVVTAGGHFLCFAVPDAAGLQRALAGRKVVADHRGGRLRVGFGLYHDPEDVDELVTRLARTLSSDG